MWALLYTLSGGKVVFWLLPNLDDEKLGVIDSFKPFYSLKFKKKKKKASHQTENQDDGKPTEDEVTELDKPVLQDEKGKKKKTAKQQAQDKEEIVLEKQDDDNEMSSKAKKKKAKQTQEEHESVDTRTKKEN